MELNEFSLAQKTIFFLSSMVVATPLYAFILLKLADWAEDGWRNNNRKKKWIVCLVVAFFIVGKSADSLFFK